MKALTQFQANIAAAESLVAMYRELRASRELGARGVLSAENQDLLWLPRSSVVATISSLDTYIHSVVKRRLPRLFRAAKTVPDALSEQLAQLLPIKNAASFKEAVPILAATDTIAQLLKKLDEKYLRFQSFQAPEKVIDAYRMVGYDNIFVKVAAIWPGPNTTEDSIKRKLSGYVQRRNQIAHEGDREANGSARPMQPDYAINCRDFVVNLVTRLDQVVYEA